MKRLFALTLWFALSTASAQSSWVSPLDAQAWFEYRHVSLSWYTTTGNCNTLPLDLAIVYRTDDQPPQNVEGVCVMGLNHPQTLTEFRRALTSGPGVRFVDHGHIKHAKLQIQIPASDGYTYSQDFRPE